jgi:hypothetical protein
MEMTISDYLKNPAGGRNHMLGQTDMAKAIYTDKFNKMMLKYAGKIKYFLFKKNDDTRYVMLIKLPSETIENLTYDVVLDFYTKDDVNLKPTNPNKYYVRFFSNDPNFTYTYAYAFNKNKMIVPELVGKLSPESVKKTPQVTNPTTTSGYVKSIYVAYLFFEMKGFMNKLNWMDAQKFTSSALNELVMPCNKKITQTNDMKKIQSATKKGSMTIATGDEDAGHLRFKANGATHMSKMVDKVKRSNSMISRASTVKTISKVRKIGRK